MFELMLLSAAGSALGGHRHASHRGMPAVGALIWLMFIVIASCPAAGAVLAVTFSALTVIPALIGASREPDVDLAP